jgi:chromosomal replication initiation ATPase DnaA
MVKGVARVQSAGSDKRGNQLTFSLTLEEKDLYSLDRFHEGDFNKIPLAAAKLFAKNGAGEEMPRSLVITGPEGSGKSHLLKGLYRRVVSERGGAASTAIIDAADISSGGDVNERLKQLYGYALVCIDSLDARERNSDFYEALFNLFNEVIGNGGHFVVAMRRSPVKAAGIPDYLYTRLLSGLVVGIKRPGDDEKRSILAKLAADRQISLTPGGIKQILERSGRSVGSLASLLGRLEKVLGKKGSRAGLQLIRSVIDST